MNIRNLMNEWFAHLPKGYAEKPYSESELNVLKDILHREHINPTEIINALSESTTDKRLPLNEAPNTFDNLIQAEFGEDPIPTVQGKYKLPNKSGLFNIDPKDVEPFVRIAAIKPQSDIGLGEVALYWLFNYGGKVRAKESRGGANADLIIDGVDVEVKAYPNPTGLLKLGVFESEHDLRRTINALFGVINLTSFMDGNKEYYTEKSFKAKDLESAYTQLLELRSTLRDMMSDAAIKAFIGEQPIFTSMLSEIELALKVDGASQSAESLATELMAELITRRLEKKVTPGGYLANLKKGDMSTVHFFKAPVDIKSAIAKLDIDELTRMTSIASGNLKLNFSELFKEI